MLFNSFIDCKYYKEVYLRTTACMNSSINSSYRGPVTRGIFKPMYNGSLRIFCQEKKKLNYKLKEYRKYQCEFFSSRLKNNHQMNKDLLPFILKTLTPVKKEKQKKSCFVQLYIGAYRFVIPKA